MLISCVSTLVAWDTAPACSTDELEKGIDPLSPDNKIIFTTSPLTANQHPGRGQCHGLLQVAADKDLGGIQVRRKFRLPI